MIMKPPPKCLNRNRTVDPLQTKSFWKFPIDEPITTNSGVTDSYIPTGTRLLILVASGKNTKGSAVDCARFGDDTTSFFRGASFGLEPALDVQCLRAQADVAHHRDTA